jgi:hypothetical protein
VTDPRSPAQRYRELTGAIADASRELRDRDADRVRELRRLLAVLDDRMERVGERTSMSSLAARTHWETALDALWAEPWMTVPPFPRPDPQADPARLTQYEQEMYEAHAELMGLVQRTRFGFRR